MARFGGDEFVTLLTDIHVEADIKQYLRRMQKVFSSPFQVNEIEFELSASIGISVYPCDAKNYNTLLDQADKAMYYAKKHEMPYYFYRDISTDRT